MEEQQSSATSEDPKDNAIVEEGQRQDNAKDAIHEDHDGNTSNFYAFAVVILI